MTMVSSQSIVRPTFWLNMTCLQCNALLVVDFGNQVNWCLFPDLRLFAYVVSARGITATTAGMNGAKFTIHSSCSYLRVKVSQKRYHFWDCSPDAIDISFDRDVSVEYVKNEVNERTALLWELPLLSSLKSIDWYWYKWNPLLGIIIL
jgi:hypothetical protein